MLPALCVPFISLQQPVVFLVVPIRDVAGTALRFPKKMPTYKEG